MCDERTTVIPVSATTDMTRLHELAAGERIERGDRLVENQKLRPFRQREGERDLRLLAPREASDPLAERQAEVGDPLAREVVVPRRVELAAELQRVGHGEALVQRVLLGDEADPGEHRVRLVARVVPEHPHRAGGRARQADRELEQRRLAGAVRADERGDRARRDLEVALCKGPLGAVALAEPVGLRVPARRSCDPRDRAGGRTVSEKRAAMPSSSRPAARARCTHLLSAVRSSLTPSGGGASGVGDTNVPTPRRPSTTPSRSSSR